MTKNPKPLQFDKVYYIMATSLEEHLLFIEEVNYPYFLGSVQKYVRPIADILAFCLLPNQMHMIVAINTKETVLTDKAAEFPDRFRHFPSRQFAHLFNSYSQATSRRYQRKGGLFKRPFYRKVISTAGQMEKCILQIHKLPATYGYDPDWENYKWSSLSSFEQDKFENLKKHLNEYSFSQFSDFMDVQRRFRMPGTPVF